MTEKPKIFIGTISIWVSLIPWLALVAYLIVNPPCSSPFSRIQDVIFAGPIVSFLVSLLGVIKDRPRKRAFIGLAISSLALLGLLTLLIFIVHAIATGSSANVQATTSPDIQNREPGSFVTTETKYYDIEGRTAQELQAQTAALGPKGHAAYTDSYYRWKYTYKRLGTLCAIDRVRVDTAITFTYPRWMSAGSDPKLTEAWSRGLAVLVSHEKGHEEIARKASQEIYGSLHVLLPAYQSCDELGRTANALAQAVIEEANKKDKEYDAMAEQGQAQPAVLP